MSNPSPGPLDLDALASAIAATLSRSRLCGYPGFRDIAAHATDAVVEISLDNGVQFEMRLGAATKTKKAKQ